VTGPLHRVRTGKTAVVRAVAPDTAGRRLMDLGFVPGTRVRVLRTSPLGDPRAYLVRGAVIALRREDAARILVSEGA